MQARHSIEDWSGGGGEAGFFASASHDVRESGCAPPTVMPAMDSRWGTAPFHEKNFTTRGRHPHNFAFNMEPSKRARKEFYNKIPSSVVNEKEFYNGCAVIFLNKTSLLNAIFFSSGSTASASVRDSRAGGGSRARQENQNTARAARGGVDGGVRVFPHPEPLSGRTLVNLLFCKCWIASSLARNPRSRRIVSSAPRNRSISVRL